MSARTGGVDAPARYLIDANVFLRLMQPGHLHHAPAQLALGALIQRRDLLFIVPQNIYEFWVVATRPAGENGLGLTPERAQLQVARLEAIYTLLPDDAPVYSEWRRLVSAHAVSGKPSHDARLIAAMKVHGLTHILSFNFADFTRYSAGENLTVVDPASIRTA